MRPFAIYMVQKSPAFLDYLCVDGFADDGVHIDHIPDVFHGGGHEAFDGMFIHWAILPFK